MRCPADNMEELYTLEREVGRGSYGVVFEGRATKTGHRVAIKRLPCNSPEGMELVLQELWAMRATATNHPNVIALHSCLMQAGPRTLRYLKSDRLPVDMVESVLKGTVLGAASRTQQRTSSTPQPQSKTQQKTRHPDPSRPKLQDMTNLGPARPRKRSAPTEMDAAADPSRCLSLWLVMEYCNGGDLNQYILSGPPDPGRNHSVVRQLSGALAFLHGLGIAHRDLKPDNVLVCLTADGPVFKVADFGLSKMNAGLEEGDDTTTRQHFSSTVGSDFYMAPEVWGGLNYSAQADIFSLGAIFWAVLERITFLEEGSTQEQLGVYMCKGSWLKPLGEALWENPDLQLCIPMKARRAPPLPPPPGQALSALLLDMLAADPDARPAAAQLEARVHSALAAETN